MKFIKIISIMCLVLVANCTGVFATEPKISVQMAATQTSTNPKGRLLADLVVTNQTGDTIYFYIDSRNLWWLGVESESNLIKPVPPPAMTDAGVGPTVVKAGETYKVPLDLTRVFTIVDVGLAKMKYNLTLRYYIPSDPDSGGHEISAQGTFNLTIK